MRTVVLGDGFVCLGPLWVLRWFHESTTKEWEMDVCAVVVQR